MNKEQLYNFVEENEFPTSFDLDSLREMVDRYPYFEAARFLYLKTLYEHDIIAFKSELSRMSVLLSNREALFYYIFKADYAQYFRHSGKHVFKEDKTDVLLNAFFESTDTNNLIFEYEVSTESLVSTDYLSYLEEEKSKKVKQEKRKAIQQQTSDNLIFFEDKAVEETPQKITQKEEEPQNSLLDLITIDSKDDEQDDLFEYEKPTSAPPLEYPIQEYVLEPEDDETDLIPLKHQNIIDKFLENSSKKEFTLSLDKEDLKDDKDYLADEEELKDETELGEDMFFTETLAKIYTKQGRYEKAYEIIEHLSLKYPRKNSYFADQLSYLEKLIINSKYKKKK